MKTGISCGIVVLMTGLLLSSASAVRGATIISWDYNNGFIPAGEVVIGVNETVTWTNAESSVVPIHLMVEGFPDYVLDQFTSKEYVFPVAGSYDITTDYGDHGVVAVNIPPLVAITNPANGTVFAPPANFDIEASASETPDDSIYSVEFFVGSIDPTNSINIDYAVPYSASVTNLAAGSYSLIALATDSRNWMQTNTITISVGGSSPLILELPRISGGQFLFDVVGLTVGRTNIVQTSTNLTAWMPIMTNVAASASATITNSPAPGPHFYRVIELPGPGGSAPIYVSLPRVSSGQFLFDIAGLTVGRTNIVQTSTNLTAWTPIMTNVAASASATITNSPAPGPHFYRVMQLP